MIENIRINIGLSSKKLGDIPFIEAVTVLRTLGFERTHTRIAQSQSEDGPEAVLVYSGRHVSSVAEVLSNLHAAAVRLGQDCIAVRLTTPSFCALDALVGPRPYDSFNSTLFIEP